MLPEIIPTTKHMLCDSLMSVLLSSITNTGQNDFITRSLLWSNMVKCSIPSSVDRFCIDLCGDHSTKAATTAQVTFLDIGRLLWGESLIFLYINTLFSTLKVALHWHGFPNLCWNRVITCAVFMHPNTCYQTLLNGLTAHNCHSHVYTTHYSWGNVTWVLAHRSFVTCALPHRVVKSCKVMPSHNMQT